MIRTISIAAVALTFIGCAIFQPQVRPAAPIALPEKYSLYAPDEAGPGKWWQAFGSAELDGLVEEALSGNFDIQSAFARLKQADAVARKVGADLNPSIAYSTGAEKSWSQTKSDIQGSSQTEGETFHAGLTAAYELDLWGRLTALRQSEVLELAATRKDLEAAAVTVAAEVVTTWLDILSARRQIAILEDQIDINHRLLKLQELRFINGKADALDISQQREALASARAKMPLLQLEIQRQQNVLAVLLGRAGQVDLPISQAMLPELIPLPASGLPADLLAARPDVCAAGLRLRSADWQVSAARADRLPAITLTADAGYASDALDLLFKNWVAALAGSITGPVFDAGYRSAEVDRTRAVAEEYLAAYANTVAEALREVEDSMAVETRQSEYIVLLEEQLKASRMALKDAHLQYMNGQDNYLDYLTAWTSVQDLERQLTAEQATLIKNRVTLYRALGGDWTCKLLPDSDPKQAKSETPNIGDRHAQANAPING